MRPPRVGWSLAEVAIALAVGALMTGAIGMTAAVQLERGRLARAVQEVDALSRAAARWPAAAGAVDYAGLSLAALQSAGLWPAGTVRHAWGGAVTLCATAGACAAFNGDPLRYGIVLDAVPAAAATGLCGAFAARAACATTGGDPTQVRLLF